MATINDISENMKNQIKMHGYNFDAVELLELRGKFDPAVMGSFCEGMFRTADGEYFKCGEGMTKSPYEQRSGLLVRAGTKLFAQTEEQANEWLANKDLSIYPGL